MLIQVDEIGTQSLPLVLAVPALLGIALTVLISFQLKEMGRSSYIPGFVAVAVFREMGPLITAMIVAGRVGAAFTARIGTMKVSEEILALETMADQPCPLPRRPAVRGACPCAARAYYSRRFYRRVRRLYFRRRPARDPAPIPICARRWMC